LKQKNNTKLIFPSTRLNESFIKEQKMREYGSSNPIQQRISMMYAGRYDGKIDEAFF
jgi:hypothetical protein